MIARALSLLLASILVAGCAQGEPRGPLVFAAASLQGAMDEVADSWAARGNAQPVISYAGTPTIARQVQQGAAADIVFFADELWMDQLARERLLRAGSRRDVLGNSMVLIGPAQPETNDEGDPIELQMREGRIAMADPDTVPAGRYARRALEQLGLWDVVAPRVVPTDNVRAALLLVERGEAPLGVVYASDAAASDRVDIVARFAPSPKHPVRYPAALTASSDHQEAAQFLDYVGSQEAIAIFTRHGFSAPQ